MAYHMTLNNYLQRVSNALNEYDGESLSYLISFKDEHVSNQKLQKENPEMFCQRFLTNPYDELFAAHLKALPIMYTLILDLRAFANDLGREGHKDGQSGKDETLEKAADTIMSCFRVCGSDGRASLEVSKKWGMLFLVNQLFKIYFKIGNIHLCKPLIRAIESSNIKDKFTLAQRVTYKFYVGRKAMFDSDFEMVKMLLGHMPPLEILHRHKLMQFADIAKAAKTGQVQLLNQALFTHEAFFIHTGVYLILEKLRAITYRTLFKRVSNILGTHQIPLQSFLSALQAQGIEDIDMDETECIVAGLIYAGNIRGYISHQHKKLVVSKVNAFPAVAAAAS